MSDAAQFIQTLAIWAIPVLFAITVHEVAHGWVAWKRGDPTAMLMGRLTLNPIKHIDPFGTILLPLPAPLVPYRTRFKVSHNIGFRLPRPIGFLLGILQYLPNSSN